MPRTVSIQHAFDSGEISPLLAGRMDVDRYYRACETLENFIPLVQGPATRRWGNRFVASALGPSRLIPFDTSPTESFALELGNQTIRFLKNDGTQVAVATTTLNGSQTLPEGTITVASTTGFDSSGTIMVGGVAVAYTGKTGTTFTGCTGGYGTWPSGTSVWEPYSISSPYDTSTADLWDIRFCQVGQTMYLTHPNYQVYKLTHVTDSNWTLKKQNFLSPGTHAFDQDVSGGTITLTPGATTGNGVTFTASSGVFLTGPDATNSGDVGKVIVYGDSLAFITSVTDSTHVVADIIDDFPNTSAIAAGSWLMRGSPGAWGAYGTISGGVWLNEHKFHAGAEVDFYTFEKEPIDPTGTNTSLAPPTQVDAFRSIDIGRYIIADNAVAIILSLTSASHITVRLLTPITTAQANAQGGEGAAPTPAGLWSVEDNAWTATHGYPRACAFYQDRLVLAGTTDQPQTIWGSVTGDYENFGKGDQDSQGLDFTLNSGSFEQIRWLETYQALLVIGTYRSEYIVGGGIQQGLGGGGQALTPTNISAQRQSKHGVSGIQPVLADTELIYIQRTKTVAFQFQFDIQQSIFSSKNLNIFNDIVSSTGFKEAVYQALPYKVIWFTTEDNLLVGLTYEQENQVWAWHRHPAGTAGDGFVSVCSIPDSDGTLDQLWSVTKRSLNGVTSYSLEVQDQSLNVDCGSHYSGAKVTSISGLGYLAGRSVVGVADGAALPAVTMTAAGVFTCPIAAADIQVGLAYTSTLVTVRPDFAGGQSIQGLLKRWSRYWVRLYNSVRTTVNGIPIPVRTPSMDIGKGVPVQTQDIEVGTLDYDRDGRVTIAQDQPLPCTVIAGFGTLVVGEQ